MTLPSVYLNPEEDVPHAVERIKKLRSSELILVCPKKCQLFSDVINLKLLKKQTDLMGKKVYLLTMDETGQAYALAAGFELKFLPNTRPGSAVADISAKPAPRPAKPAPAASAPSEDPESLSASAESPPPIFRPKASMPSAPVQPSEPAESKPAAILSPAESAPKSSPAAETAASQPEARPRPTIRVISSEEELLEQNQNFSTHHLRSPVVIPREFALEQKIKKPNSRKSSRYAFTGAVALFLILITFLAFVVLPRGKITVYARSEPINRDIEVSVATSNKQIDADKLALPATKVADIIQVSDKFSTTGKKEIGNKATGTVTIYNFTGKPLNLKVATTNLLLNGKVYNLVSDVQDLRPTRYKNSATQEVDESTLGAPISVIASQGGDSYNIPAGTRLEITNQVLGSKPQVLYAKTQTPISGGTSRFLSVITDQDIAAARDALAQEALSSLRGKLSQTNLVLPDKSFSLQAQDFSSDQAVGTETPTFNASLKASITGLAFGQGDIVRLIHNRISQTLSSNKTLEQETPDAITYELNSIDLNSGTAVYLVHYNGKAVWDVSLDGLQQEVEGKTPSEVNELLQSRPEIERIDITLSPAWQKTFPWFARNTQVELVK